MAYGYQIGQPVDNGGYGYGLGEWVGGYRVGGNAESGSAPSNDPNTIDSPQLDFGEWSGPVDEYGQPIDPGGSLADLNNSLGAQDNTAYEDPYNQFATEFQTPGGSPYGTSDNVFTNYTAGLVPGNSENKVAVNTYGLPIGQGPQATESRYPWMNPSGGTSTTGGSTTSSGRTGGGTSGRITSGGVQPGSTSQPAREVPRPFGTQFFASNDLPGGQAQPATGSNDTAFFMQKLKDLISSPGAISSNPEYQFAFEQGMNALNRTAAAKRQRFSPSTMLEAQKFGQGLASQQYKTLADVLGASLGRATSQYGQDVGRYLGEQGLTQGFGTDSYTAWQNSQRNAGAQTAADTLARLADALNIQP